MRYQAHEILAAEKGVAPGLLANKERSVQGKGLRMLPKLRARAAEVLDRVSCETAGALSPQRNPPPPVLLEVCCVCCVR